MKKSRRLLTLFLAVLFIFSALSLPALARGWSTTSTEGVELRFPTKKEMLPKLKAATVKAKNGAIYFMPVPKAGNGNLGTVRSNQTVYLLAKRSGYYFFVTKDGRFGWNGAKYFETQKTVSATKVLKAIDKNDLDTDLKDNDGFTRLKGLLKDRR